MGNTTCMGLLALIALNNLLLRASDSILSFKIAALQRHSISTRLYYTLAPKLGQLVQYIVTCPFFELCFISLGYLYIILFRYWNGPILSDLLLPHTHTIHSRTWKQWDSWTCCSHPRESTLATEKRYQFRCLIPLTSMAGSSPSRGWASWLHSSRGMHFHLWYVSVSFSNRGE